MSGNKEDALLSLGKCLFWRGGGGGGRGSILLGFNQFASDGTAAEPDISTPDKIPHSRKVQAYLWPGVVGDG